MRYHIYYETKHLSAGTWIVYSTEFIDDEPGEVTIIFKNLTSTEARKACAALRKAHANGKRHEKVSMIRRLKRT